MKLVPQIVNFNNMHGKTMIKTKGGVNKNRWLLIPASKPPIWSRYAPSFVKAGASLPCLQEAFAGLCPVSDYDGPNSRTIFL
jgi:hypothetical protein